MKISKVNHKRAAVTIKENSATGILYKTPNNDQAEEDLVKYIQKLNKNARRLYAVLSTPQNKKDYSEIELYVLKQVHPLLIAPIIKIYDEEKTIEKNLDAQIKKINNIFETESAIIDFQEFEGADEKNYESLADKLVRTLLRNSLKKTVRIENQPKDICCVEESIYLPTVLKKLIRAMCSEISYLTIPENEIRTLLKYIDKDYAKVKPAQLAESIKKQGVKTEVAQEGNGYYLRLANAATDKKKYIFEFVSEYVHHNESERKNMLMDMKKLFILYLYGKEEYEQIKNIEITMSGRYIPKKNVSRTFVADSLEKKNAELKKAARDAIMQHYCSALKALSEDSQKDEKKFWIGYAENVVEKTLLSKKYLDTYKLQCNYLLEVLWKEFQSYIAMKYVDLGKAVYHFVLPELSELDGNKAVSLGEVREEFQKGISSFDYEYVKAKDDLERAFMTYISFAVHNFSRAVYSDEARKGQLIGKKKKEKEGYEDVLTINNDTLKQTMREDSIKQILAYFGGYSKWNKDETIKIAEMDEGAFQTEMKDLLQFIRNNCFHYAATATVDERPDVQYVSYLFEKEYEDMNKVNMQKYYSNNVQMFYPLEGVKMLFAELYGGSREYPAQIPAFENIVKRTKLQAFLNSYVNGKPMKGIINSGYATQYRGAMYFLLKEIYYNLFLQEPDLVQRFLKALKDQKEGIKNESPKDQEKLQMAMEDFEGRIKELLEQNKKQNKNTSFGEICQQIMCDYNMQNQGKQKICSNKNEEKDYDHFPLLLYTIIKNTFLDYLKEKDENGKTIRFAFLKTPEYKKTTISLEEFYEKLGECQMKTFEDLKGEVSQSKVSAGWYVMAHFMTPKQLNHLMGDIKGYILFLDNISKRAESTNTRMKNDGNLEQQLMLYHRVLRVLEFVKQFVGRTSNVLEDYFTDDDEYAKYIWNYVNYGKDAENNQLISFCGKEITVQQKKEKNTKKSKDKSASIGKTFKLGIYADEKRPILNRNIVISKLYGNEKLLTESLKEFRITENEITQYYKKMEALEAVFKTGVCKKEEEQKGLREFQQMKNRIELRDLVALSEITNDYMSQLISWCYLRERDLMYFQLGVHYLRLFYGSEEQRNSVAKKYRKLKGQDIQIAEGAILYQIVAMYSYNLPVYKLDDCGEAVPSSKIKGKISDGVNAFYKEYCQTEEVYNTALELFEYMGEHREIFDFRNYIDHFKYYTWLDQSMLDLYSNVFDRFFTYDKKLKKSVSFVFKNILMKYFIIVETKMEVTTVEYQDANKNDQFRKACKMVLSENGGLKSDVFTYKLLDESKTIVELPVHSDKFLGEVKAILEYCEKD